MVALAINRVQSAVDAMEYNGGHTAADELLSLMIEYAGGKSHNFYTSESFQVLTDAMTYAESLIGETSMPTNDKIYAWYRIVDAENNLEINYSIPEDAKLIEIASAIESGTVDYIPDEDTSLSTMMNSYPEIFESFESFIAKSTAPIDWDNMAVDRVYLAKAKPGMASNIESAFAEDLSSLQSNPDWFTDSEATVANGTIKVEGDYVFLIVTGDTPEKVQAIVDIIDGVLV